MTVDSTHILWDIQVCWITIPTGSVMMMVAKVKWLSIFLLRREHFRTKAVRKKCMQNHIHTQLQNILLVLNKTATYSALISFIHSFSAAYPVRGHRGVYLSVIG